MLIVGNIFIAIKSLIVLAITTDVNPIVNPTERSIPPVIITKVTPIPNNIIDVDAKKMS